MPRTFPSSRDALPRFECSVTFLTPDEGGRSTPFTRGALTGDAYRPHLVIGEPTQRRAVVVDGKGVEEYIGVSFNLGPECPETGVEMTVRLTAIYYPHLMYEKLRPGVTFTVREGAQVVAFGSVRRWIE